MFSGFKTDRQLKDISKLLFADGKLKPFNRFRDEVLKIHKNYNVNWLKAEYNQAVSATQSAVRWNKFEQNADRYYLQYRTAGDERVRSSHAVLNRITLPMSHDFWNEHYTPNGWGCRCSVIQVLKSQYDATSEEDVKTKTKDFFKGNDKIFAYNPGKTIAPFPSKHPYYKVQTSLADVITNEALNLWARTNAKSIAKNTIETNKDIIGKSFNMENITEAVLVVKNTFTKNLRFGNGFIKRITILENLEIILPSLKYKGLKKVIEKDYTTKQWKKKNKQWKKKKEIIAYHFFTGEFNGINFSNRCYRTV